VALWSDPKRLHVACAVKEMPESSTELVRAAVRVAVERFETIPEWTGTALLNVVWEPETRTTIRQRLRE
jgi:hypothetical protein